MLGCAARWIAGGTPCPPLGAEGRWNWILSHCCTTGSPSQVVKGVLALTFTNETHVESKCPTDPRFRPASKAQEARLNSRAELMLGGRECRIVENLASTGEYLKVTDAAASA
jgi:hypothetical protein